MAEKLITKQVLIDAIDEAFDEIEGLRLAGELPGNPTHGLFTRELLNALEAKGYDLDNPENIKRLDNWALNSGFSDTKSFADLIIADVKEPTLVQSAYPGNFFDDDLNIIKTAQPKDTIFSESITKDVIKNEILNGRSSLDENTIEYIKKNTDTPTNVVDDVYNNLNEAVEKFINEDIIPFTSGDFQKMIGVKSLKDVDGNIVPWTSYFDDLIDDSAVNEFLLFLQSAGDISLSQRDTRQIGKFLYEAKTNPETLKGFALDKNKIDNVGHLVWSTIQKEIPQLRASFFDQGNPNGLRYFGKNLVKYFNISDTPSGSLGAAKLNDPLVFDSWVDNLGRTTTSFVDNLPLETVVKNRIKNLITTKTKQLAKPGSLVVKAVDAWEFGVIGLMAAGIAFNEIDEVPTIINNTAINMFNSMTAPYGIAPVEKEEYDIDYEFINTVLDTGSKVMPTDIIIEKLKPYSLEEGEDVILPGTGVTATTGAKQQFEPYGEELAKRAEKTVNIKRDEVKQDLLESKGVQEEKMFEQAKTKKSKATGGAGAKIL